MMKIYNEIVQNKINFLLKKNKVGNLVINNINFYHWIIEANVRRFSKLVNYKLIYNFEKKYF